MGALKWYKRDPRAALSGMMALTLEECGAYNKILDLMYLRDGKLIDDAQEICRWLNCNVRTWKRIRGKLIDLEKIYVHAGCLHNERTDEEISRYRRKCQTLSESALKRWAVYNEIKGLPDAYPMQSRTRLRKLSANIVPLSRDSQEKKVEISKKPPPSKDQEASADRKGKDIC